MLFFTLQVCAMRCERPPQVVKTCKVRNAQVPPQEVPVLPTHGDKNASQMHFLTPHSEEQ
jgi:hypothetical protein